MVVNQTAYVALACTSGVLNVYLGLYVFTRRHEYREIAGLFITYVLTVMIYCFGAAFGMTSSSLDGLKFWTDFQYIGMPFAPPLGLLFIMKYLGRKVTKKTIVILLLIPAITFGMVITNSLHHLHYQVFELHPALGAPYTHLEIGPWYAVHGLYTFSCMFTAFFLVLGQWRETAKHYRPQLLVLLGGQLVPMLAAFIYLMGMTPPGIDPVPLVLWLTTLLYLMSVNTSKLFRILPVAKDAIFHSIDDGVIVLDETHKLVEFNDACSRMFPLLERSMYGKELSSFWEQITNAAFPFPKECGVYTWEMPSTDTGVAAFVFQVRITRMNPVRGAKGLLIIFTDITELKRLQKKLEEQAYKDELTKVYNRRAFFEMSEAQVLEAKETDGLFAVGLFDIDYFKNVNDTYGHQVGDEVLIHVAHICKVQLGDAALFARYGGEEFVMALKGSTIAEAELEAERVRKAVEAEPLITDEQTIHITLSGGVAELDPQRKDSMNVILNRADEALYEAKRTGRNRICRSAGMMQGIKE